MTEAPIGVFDSGFGGLTVAREVLDQLPHESVLYLGDTARTPYGPRPIAQVREFSLECLDRLVEHGVKALVIACNSASAAVLADARERYAVPVVEVIRPAVRRAMAVTRNGQIGVISTAATHQSRAYVDSFVAAPPSVQVASQPCPRFVELVEAGVTSGPEVIEVARAYLEPLRQRDIDTLILGCTHYPLLTQALQYVLGEQVMLVSSAAATAADLFRVLTDSGLLAGQDNPPVHQWLTTGDPDGFHYLARRFLGPEVEQVHRAFVGRPEERV
ncbi:glutamate racemase [Serinicoccus kebangsaanensis]|uniref:glutamate racemase n=1 Tax=Serinicoccus kebangsaanensis TaxID=2602069 RepID=UPI00124D45BD|nr:glutamate racemase [Serinicoccus kebangsaanensis]